MTLVTFSANIVGKARPDVMEGRDYLVLPVCILREGVYNGSNGPTMYESKDLETYTPAWNSKPIVINHPKQNGQFVSADDPAILSTTKVGKLMRNSMKGNGQFAEAWLEKSRLEKIEPRILKAIEKGITIEVSTGLFSDNEQKTGEFNGRQYNQIARNYRPDHLALLPDMVGACSIADGCGLFTAAEAVPFEKMEQIQDVLNRTWKGETMSANCSCKNKEKTMNRKVQIDALVASGVWEETDRPELEKMDEKTFDKVFKMNEAKKADPPKKEEPPKEEPKANAEAKKEEPKVEEKKPVTLQEFLASAPAELQDVLANGLSAHQAQRTRLIDTIISNKQNLFTKEELSDEKIFNVARLHKLAELAVNKEEEKPQGQSAYSPFSYIGNQGAPQNNGVKAPEPLPLPSSVVAKS